MSADTSGPDAARVNLLAWLGELGPRWGVPRDACLVHGWLYFTDGESSPQKIAQAIEVDELRAGEALDWLRDHRLVETTGNGRWTTLADPWEMVLRALDVRRQRELDPALSALRTGLRESAADPILSGRIRKLLALVEDVAAIDAQAQRLSPAILRGMIGAGGHAARIVGRLTGRAKGSVR